MEKDLVSVIVPVYNVSGYLDACVHSLLAQTYENIEILLIDDGSTDDSARKCRKWEHRDARIRFFTKQNEGLGPTREYGVRQIKGGYFSFVDSDDWVEPSYIEALHEAIADGDADLAECDYYTVHGDGSKSVVATNRAFGKRFSKAERMVWSPCSQWKMMFRTAFYRAHSFCQPRLPMEDMAVYALQIALARKTAYVPRPLYCYRKSRAGSIMQRKESFWDAYQPMQYLLDGFKRESLFEMFSPVLRQCILRRSSRVMVPRVSDLLPEEHRLFRKNFVRVLEANFAGFQDRKAFLWGSYNLTKIVQSTDLLEDPYYRFSFSSLVSLMSNRLSSRAARHPNPYRMLMLERERTHQFWTQLEEERPQYLFLDLMEERHNLLERDGAIWTKSDALLESDFALDGWREIPRTSAECQTLWRESCQKFIARIRQCIEPSHVVLVANTLAERYGSMAGSHTFPHIAEIRETNKILVGYYDFFQAHFPEVQVIEAANHPLYVTDAHFEYGCVPWHLNLWMTDHIGRSIGIESHVAEKKGGA